MEFVKKLKPAVGKNWLVLIAGLTWSAVSVMLCRYAIEWWLSVDISPGLLFGLCGCLLGAAIYRFGFSKLADKNIRRIEAYQGVKVCVFAFQAWTSYPLVAFMIFLGIFLRKYSPIPKPNLGVMYLGIGMGLFLASLHFFRHLFFSFNTKKMQEDELHGG